MRTYRDTTVSIEDLVALDEQRNSFWITDVTLDGCVVRGPAVLFVANQSVSFEHCSLHADMIWPIETDRAYIGAIGLRNVRFHRCSFGAVGLAASREWIQRLFEA